MGASRGIVLVMSAIALGACGGGRTKTGSGSAGAKTAATVAAKDGTAKDAAAIDKTISTALEVGTGQRGKKEDAPGKMRFANYLAKDGKAIDVDVWWGQPDEGQKAATVKFGEVSPYLTPRRTAGFTSAPYSVTAVGSTEVLFSWDRFDPKKGSQRTVIWGYDGADLFEQDKDESATLIDGSTNKPEFAPPTNGKVTLKWFVLGDAISTPDRLLVVSTGGKCLTNGSGIADPNDELGNSLNDYSIDTFDADPGAVLSFIVGCGGEPLAGTSVKVPAKGRGLLLAYLDAAGKPVLTLLPVADTP
jgi:hypothetical protein